MLIDSEKPHAVCRYKENKIRFCVMNMLTDHATPNHLKQLGVTAYSEDLGQNV